MLQLQSRRKASPAHRFQVADQEKIEGPKKKATSHVRKKDERRITKELENHCAVHEYQSGCVILYVYCRVLRYERLRV